MQGEVAEGIARANYGTKKVVIKIIEGDSVPKRVVYVWEGGHITNVTTLVFMRRTVEKVYGVCPRISLCNTVNGRKRGRKSTDMRYVK